MNFFEHQEAARRMSRRLVVLFALAVISIVVAVNVVATFVYLGIFAPPLPRGFYLTNTVVTLLMIGAGTWWETARLARGGEAVAQMIGARRVDPSTRDLLERRLVNVVEEMALASGTPVPRLYVMENEQSINAFAAGHSLHDAVIAVTRGTLTRLTRDELQGVIGHEFSHILNGDMRLNIRLIGVLFGLLMLSMFGRFMLELGRGSRDSRGGLAMLVVAGIALWILGYVGVVFGRLIKAAVSRQREYLADASSVQFTRNPDGIGGALRKIGGLTQPGEPGSAIRHPNAETLSHLFLGAARPSFVAGLFATHPPLAARIKRVYGRELPMLPAGELPLAEALREAAVKPGADEPLPYPDAAAAAISPLSALVGEPERGAQVAGAIGSAIGEGPALAQAMQRLAGESDLEAALVDTSKAQLVVLAMLIEKDKPFSGQQRQLVAEAFGAEAAQQVDAFHELIQRQPPGLRLPLLDRAGPTLLKLGVAVRERLLQLVHGLVRADGRVTLHEFLLFTVLRRRIGRDAHRPVPIRFAGPEQLQPEIGLVMSLLASVRLPEHPERAYNAGLLLLAGIDPPRVPTEAIELDAVSRALDRLNQLAPLAKPRLIKACAAVAFVDGETHWKAASCLRTVCAALDAPLPPQLRDDGGALGGQPAPAPAAGAGQHSLL
ncbi:MAG: M48 family metallopeptidase [Burkholderiaceae bacterium]|jgi:Zn-dependent protease with chaperone function|nr:M48 family metallopeptidase [Burkholderiaceae bacterium]